MDLKQVKTTIKESNLQGELSTAVYYLLGRVEELERGVSIRDKIIKRLGDLYTESKEILEALSK